MKSKKMIIVPVICALILCLLCGIGFTVAKYVTTQTKANPETGRVAKWGVVIDTTAFKGFETSYSNNTTTIVASANGTDKLFAPGGSGTFAKVGLTGSPEVRCNVSYDVTFTFTGWTINTSEEYMPIVFTIGGTEYKVDGTTYADVAALKAALDVAADFSQDYDVNTDLSTVNPTTIAWSWAFEGENTKDTALGDLATAPTVAVTVTANVTQVNA